MTSRSLFFCFGVLGLTGWMLAGPALGKAGPADPLAPPVDEGGPTAQTVDQVLLEELAAQQGVVTQMQDPGLMQYAQDTMFRLTTLLAEWVGGWFGELVGFVGLGGVWFLRILFVALAGLILLLLVRALASRRKRPSPSLPMVAQGAAEEEPGASEDRWEDELRRHLATGAGAEAAAALWWWLASRLVPDGVDRAWTSRELLERADRRDLLPTLRSLDRILYGALEPVADEVAKLWDELQETLR